MQDEYDSGIGGALLFLIIYLLTLQPLAAFVGLLLTHASVAPGDGAWHPLDINVWYSTGAYIAVGMIAAILLRCYRRRISVRLAILAVCILPPLLAASGFLAPIEYLQSPKDATLNVTTATSTAGALVWSALWFWYLQCSRRVRDHYAS